MNHIIAQSLQNIEDATDGAPESQAASERAASEPAGPAKVVAAVATCSLPVSSAEALCVEWEMRMETARERRAAAIKRNDQGSVGEWEVREYAIKQCVQDIRREMARATQRQPEENVRDEPRRGE